MIRKIQPKMMLVLSSACLFQTVGCPQIFGDALQTGLRTFIEVGLPAALLTAVDIEGILGTIIDSTGTP